MTKNKRKYLIVGLLISGFLMINWPTYGQAKHDKSLVEKNQVKKRTKNKNRSLLKPIKMRWDMQRTRKHKLPVGWEAKSGVWTIEAEPEQPTNKILYQKELKRDYQEIMTTSAYGNFDLSVKLKADSFKQRTKNWQMGILFHYVDADHYYKLRITAANIALVRYSKDEQTILPGSQGTRNVAGATGKRARSGEKVVLILPIGSVSDLWHTLEVNCYGERIEIKLDQREVRTVTDMGVGAGSIGIFTYKTRAFIDDIKLSYLPLPSSDIKILPTEKSYSPSKGRGLLIYYLVKEPGMVDFSIYDSRDKLFAELCKHEYHVGLNSLVWYGHGILGKQPRPGKYKLELKTDKQKKYQATILIQ